MLALRITQQIIMGIRIDASVPFVSYVVLCWDFRLLTLAMFSSRKGQ